MKSNVGILPLVVMLASLSAVTVVESAARLSRIAPGQIDAVNIPAVRLHSSRIKIITDPMDAEVLLGDTSLGRASTAGLAIDLPSGESVFRVEKAGYESVEKRFFVDEQVGNQGEAVVVVVRLPQQHQQDGAPPQSTSLQVPRADPRATSAAPVATALVAMLQSEDRKVREKAAVGLGKAGPDARESVPALIRALSDRSWQVRLSAAEALGRIGPDASPAVSALLEATKDSNLATSIKASRAIEQIGAASLPALTVAMQSPDARIRKEAASLSRKILAKSGP